MAEALEKTSLMNDLDPETLGRLLDQHAAALELYAAQWSNAPEDIVQEAFLELTRQSPLPEQIVPWLYRVVRNRAVSVARSRHRRRRHELAAAEVMTSWFEMNEAATLDGQTATEALQSLPAEQREVIVARIWGELTFEQIAEVTDMSPSTAHRRYETALTNLREKLGVPWHTKHR